MKRADLTVEFRLVAACCRWPRGDKRNRAIRQAALQPIDWDKFLAVVDRQRLAGLAHSGLRDAGVVLPEAAAAALAARAGDTARQSLQLALEASRLQALFDAAGIPALFIKGSALAMLAYGNLAIKQAWDIDLLVPPAAALRACALLEDAGYKRLVPFQTLAGERFAAWLEFARESIFHNAQRSAHVELHWRLSDNAAQLADVTAASPSQGVEIAPDRALRTLRDEDLFAYLCLHGAHHAWARLKWLADLSAWLSDKDAAEIVRLYRYAKDNHVGRAAAQGLLLCRMLFALDLPDALVAEIGRGRAIGWLVSTALEAMAGAGTMSESLDAPLGNFKVEASHFLLAEGLRHWLQEVRSKSIGWQDFHYMALPRPLYFLYPLLRLPSWAWRKTARLMREREAAR